VQKHPLISRLRATASPEGEAFKAFSFRRRWRDVGATDEVSLHKPSVTERRGRRSLRIMRIIIFNKIFFDYLCPMYKTLKIKKMKYLSKTPCNLQGVLVLLLGDCDNPAFQRETQGNDMR
jgi:hypothetical protein